MINTSPLNLHKQNMVNTNHDFFFHPLSERHSSGRKLASVVTMIALSILTCGVYFVIFSAVNLHDYLKAKNVQNLKPQQTQQSQNNDSIPNSTNLLIPENDTQTVSIQKNNNTQIVDQELDEPEMTDAIRAEVARHNNMRDAWIILFDRVYDITSFLEKHPGGDEVLMDVAGTDATEMFQDFDHSAEAYEMLKDYEVPLKNINTH